MPGTVNIQLELSVIGAASYWALSSVILWPWILFLPYVGNLDSNLWELLAGLELTFWIQIRVYWWRERQDYTHGAFWPANPAESELCLQWETLSRKDEADSPWGSHSSSAPSSYSHIHSYTCTTYTMHTHAHKQNMSMFGLNFTMGCAEPQCPYTFF